MSSEQRAVVQAFVDGRDVFVCLPTGSGKSLCYWILPGVFDRLRGPDGIVVVVSPLKALMREQVEALKGRGSRAVCVGDALCDDQVGLQDEIQEGRYQFLFLSPELLLTNHKWRDMLTTSVYKQHLVAFIVDEAHCIKSWLVSHVSVVCVFIQPHTLKL